MLHLLFERAQGGGHGDLTLADTGEEDGDPAPVVPGLHHTKHHHGVHESALRGFRITRLFQYSVREVKKVILLPQGMLSFLDC